MRVSELTESHLDSILQCILCFANPCSNIQWLVRIALSLINPSSGESDCKVDRSDCGPPQVAFQSLQHKEEVKSRAATASHLIGDNDGDDASSSLVHNCTIFLCSLDVRNIDDPYRNPIMNNKDHRVG